VDEEGFHGVADAGALAFRVEGDVEGHSVVSVSVHENMADAVVVFDDGHAGGGDNGFDERVASARDDDIHELVHGGHDFHGLAVFGRDELDGVVGEAGIEASGLEGFRDGEVRGEGFGAAAEDDGVAGLDA
jgi:hypothetical protein